MFVLNPLTGEFDQVSDPFQEPFTFFANCLSTDSVGQAVYISADSVGGTPQVTAADISNTAKMPAVGVILSKGSTTTCVVAYFGVIPGTSLSPNARYFVGSSSTLVSSIPVSRPAVIQVMGQALDSSRLLLTPSQDLVNLQ